MQRSTKNFYLNMRILKVFLFLNNHFILFLATSKLIENELELQINELTLKFEAFHKENEKNKQEIANLKVKKFYILKKLFFSKKKENGILESSYKKLFISHEKLLEQQKSSEARIVSLENDLDQVSSQKRSFFL